MVLWGFSFIWFKEAIRYFHPMTVVFFRLLLASVVLFAVLYPMKKITRIKKKDRKYFFLLALCEPFLYFIGESNGLTIVSATIGSVIIALIPVFSSIFAMIFLKEKLKILNYAGICISFTGIVIFIFNADSSLAYNTKGLLLMFLAVVSAIGYNIFIGKLAGLYNPVFIVFVQMTIGCLLFLPVFMVCDIQHVVSQPFAVKGLIPVAELGIFASCGAFILYSYAIAKTGVTRSAIFTNCIPVITAIFSFLILGEQLTLQNITGMIIVIAGLMMSQSRQQKDI